MLGYLFNKNKITFIYEPHRTSGAGAVYLRALYVHTITKTTFL